MGNVPSLGNLAIVKHKNNMNLEVKQDPNPKKFVSYNVNGIRAAINKGLIDWLKHSDADLIGLQEVKATENQIDSSVFMDLGYYTYWHPAVKRGYSGVALLSKVKQLLAADDCVINGEATRFYFSAGVTCHMGQSLDQQIARANTYLRNAKESGGNMIVDDGDAEE